MPASSSFDDVRLDVSLGGLRSPSVADPDKPFRITFFGDFSGRADRRVARTAQELSSLRPIAVDRDNLDEVMAGLDVRVPLPEAGEVRLPELDAFHPDHLYRDLAFFDKVRKAEQQLLSLPARGIPAPKRRSPTPPPELGYGSLIERAVEATEREAAGEPKSPDALQAWVDEQVAPHLVPKADQRVSELRLAVAETAAAQMRAVLHFPSFQSLEALWRTLDLLVRRVETSAELTIRLIDVSKQELAADLFAGLERGDSAMSRLLDRLSEEAPLAVLLGAYAFEATSQDMELLARLGTLAAGMGAPWISDAGPTLVGCRSFAETPDATDWTWEPNPHWQALRRLPIAPWVGLALPRVLLRLPYGSSTDPCELMVFEEMADTPEHDRYLWGSGAVACGCLLAESFADRGWDFLPGDNRDLAGLPLHAYLAEGEEGIQSPAEVSLGERAAERALEHGLMPLVAPRNRDTVRVVRFQSIADPAAPLAGGWNQG